MRAIGHPKLVIGVSGGLDSTHALIVAARAMDRRGPAAQRHHRVHPARLRHRDPDQGQRAAPHARPSAITYEELDITETARLMLKNLGHPFSAGEPLYDITFENVQAGLRTDYLFRAANQRDGIVLGTGDLSELALGWCTYGVGDQMSHYNVNGGVPKTLIQHLIRWVANTKQFDTEVNEVLLDVLDTEITPELVPTGEDEEVQSSEAKVGPVLAAGLHPVPRAALGLPAEQDRVPRVARLARPGGGRLAARLPGRRAPVVHARRRSSTGWRCSRSGSTSSASSSARRCRTDRRSAHGGSLSPRGDWRAPSDLPARIWLDEIRTQVPDS